MTSPLHSQTDRRPRHVGVVRTRVVPTWGFGDPCAMDGLEGGGAAP